MKNEQTSKTVASLASSILRNKRSSKTAKWIAASALTQAREKKEGSRRRPDARPRQGSGFTPRWNRGNRRTSPAAPAAAGLFEKSGNPASNSKMNDPFSQPAPADEVFRTWFLALVAGTNGLVAFAAALDGTWGAIGMMVAWVPIMNFLFGLVGVMAVVPLRRKTPALAVGAHIVVMAGSAIAAVPLTFASTAAFCEVLSLFR